MRILFVYSHWRSNQVNFDRDLWRPNCNSSPESVLHCIDTLVGEAGTLEVSSDLDGLLSELSLDVLNKHRLRVLVKVEGVEKAAEYVELYG